MYLTLPIKIALLAFIVVTIGVGGVSYFGYQDVANLLRQQALVNVAVDVERETSILAQTMKKAREDVLFMAEAPPIFGLVRAIKGKGYDDHQNMTDQMWRMRLEGLFSTILRQRKLYDKIRFIGVGDHNREIVRVDRNRGGIQVIPQSELQQKSNRYYLQQVLKLKRGTVYFSNTDLNYEYGQPTLPLMLTLRVGIPVYSKSGDIFGALILNINFGALAKELFSTVPFQTQFFIASPRGEYLYHSDPSKIFALNPNGRQTLLKDDYPDFKFTDLGHLDKPSNEIVPGKTIMGTSKKNGIAYQHLHFSNVKKTGYYIIGASVSHEVINATASDFGGRLLTLVIFAASILGMIILVFTQIITRPILVLSTVASRIATGDKNVNFPKFGSDEVGILGQSIEDMYIHLEDSRRHLQNLAESQESMVEERTRQLAVEIDERKQVEKKIKASLKEKEILLQEIHHRVKNNLQVVSSLLSLQAGMEKNQGIVAALQESERRVRVMARVHENIYRATDLAHVSAKEYLNAIVKDAKMTLSNSSQCIVIIEDIDDVILDIECAIPIGQIVSELISNVFKYAFPDNREGVVTISLKHIDNQELELAVTDNGIGLPKNFEWEQSDTLGLKLVNALCMNLNGTITVTSEEGTRIGIKFLGGESKINIT